MIIKKFINVKSQNRIKSIVCGDKTQWCWREGLIIFDRSDSKYHKKGLNGEPSLEEIYPNPEAPMFMHQISKYKNVWNPDYFNGMTVPLLKIFEEKTPIRIKTIKRSQLNLYPRVSIIPEEHKGSLHRDIQYAENLDVTKHLSLLYFVINSDGPTVTYDDDMNVIERGYPIQGDLMYYPSIYLHQPFVPTLNKRRITLQIEVEIF